MKIPVGVWLFHRQSHNCFKVTKVHPLHVETLNIIDDRVEPGLANRDMLEHALDAGLYTIDTHGA